MHWGASACVLGQEAVAFYRLSHTLQGTATKETHSEEQRKSPPAHGPPFDTRVLGVTEGGAGPDRLVGLTRGWTYYKPAKAWEVDWLF